MLSAQNDTTAMLLNTDVAPIMKVLVTLKRLPWHAFYLSNSGISTIFWSIC